MKPQFLRTDWGYLVNVANIDWLVVTACVNVSGFKIVVGVGSDETDVARFDTRGEADFALVSLVEEIAEGVTIVRATV